MIGLDLAGLAALTALVLKLTDFAKMATNGAAALRQMVTQLVAWGIAVAAVFVYGASQWANTVVLSGFTLATANGATKVLIGLTLGSSASLVQTAIKAIDNTQTASVPQLNVPGASKAPTAAASSPVPATGPNVGYYTTGGGSSGVTMTFGGGTSPTSADRTVTALDRLTDALNDFPRPAKPAAKKAAAPAAPAPQA